MTPQILRQSEEFGRLVRAAARLGADPRQVQGPGGNVSIKTDDVMLVKASGTWLSDAGREDIFTAVDRRGMVDAVRAGDASADAPATFQIAEGLKPSIETGFHAALDARIVLHTHCVATMARSTAPISTADLDALRLVQVPYIMPGATLAQAILSAWQPGARGAVLCNHGIIAVGDRVDAAERVLADAAAAFDAGPVPVAAADPHLEDDLAESGWKPLGSGATNALALDAVQMARACGPALCPDQVIFLGPAPFVSEALPIAAPEGPAHALAFLPGRGAAIPRDASPAQEALAMMMGEVVFRLPDAPTRLPEAEIAHLLGWEAEKYRQALEAKRAKRIAEGRL